MTRLELSKHATSSITVRWAFSVVIMYILPVSHAMLTQMPGQSLYPDPMLSMNTGMGNPLGSNMPTQHYHHHYHHHYLYPPAKSTTGGQNATTSQQQQQPAPTPPWGHMTPGSFTPFGGPSPYYNPSMNPMAGGGFNPPQSPFMSQFPSPYPGPFRPSPYSDPNAMRMMMGMQGRMMGMPMYGMNMPGNPFHMNPMYMGAGMMSDPLLSAAQTDPLYSSMYGSQGMNDPLGMSMISGMPAINDPLSYGMQGSFGSDIFSPSLQHHYHRLLSASGSPGTSMLNMLGGLGHHRTGSHGLRKKKCKCRLVLH